MIDTAAAERLLREALGSKLYAQLELPDEAPFRGRPMTADFRGKRYKKTITYKLGDEDAAILHKVVQVLAARRIAGYVAGASPFDSMRGGAIDELTAGEKMVSGQTRDEIFEEFSK